MRRFATTFALLALALSATACDPHQAITNALPGGCNPPAPIPLTNQQSSHETVLDSNVPDVNIPADVPNTQH